LILADKQMENLQADAVKVTAAFLQFPVTNALKKIVLDQLATSDLQGMRQHSTR
jgi:hypothetical protein